MHFCITYLCQPPFGEPLQRKHVKTATYDKVLLFKTQRRAMRWIVKYGRDEFEYSVDPWHDLQGEVFLTRLATTPLTNHRCEPES